MPADEPTAPYLDTSLPIPVRVADLVGRMSLGEKVSQLCAHSSAIDGLGFGAYDWGGECLHGLCHTGRATMFPQAIGLAATFDVELVQQVADAISTEARAKHHDPVWHGPDGPRVGLTYWTPVINIFRDPRWGRGQETYGEDPFLTGAMGAAFVRGLQGDDPRWLKVSACAKHYAVHSGPEAIRTEFDARVSPKDLRETYLPAFKMLVDAGVASVMGAYNRVNGEACCGSRTLLVDTLRGEWGFDGFVCSDAGAVAAMHRHHKVTEDALHSVVLALSCGCDLDIGRNYRTELPEAVEKGLLSEEDVDRSLSRVLTARFRLGMFDPPESVPYAAIRGDAVQCERHIALARGSAVKSCVLLKNNGILPLGPEVRTVNVSGPNAADVDMLLGNFYRSVSARLVSILEGIVGAAPEGTTISYSKGCHLAHRSEFPSTWSVGLAEWADVVVAVMGITALMEGESGECFGTPTGGDRPDIGLPENQLDLLRKLKATGKPLVVVVTGGSPIAMPEVHEMADAVLFVWYPGEQGGAAVGDILFGRECPSGRLPVTFPMSLEQVPPFEDYSMAGRTYRYSDQVPLYPFGFGLSYTRFEYGELALSAQKVRRGEGLSAEVQVRNAGDPAYGGLAEEVVQLYIRDDEATARTPLRALKAVQRVRLAPGEAQTVRFEITPQMMELVDEEGEALLEPGTFTVWAAAACPDERSEELGAPKPAMARFELM